MQESSEWQDIASLEPAAGAPRSARQLVSPFLERAGLRREAIEDFLVAVGEAVTSAVEHGINAPADRITLRYRRSAEVNVGVHSSLNGWDAKDLGGPMSAGPHDAASLSAIRHYLVRRLVDRVSVEKEVSKGTFVTLAALLPLAY